MFQVSKMSQVSQKSEPSETPRPVTYETPETPETSETNSRSLVKTDRLQAEDDLYIHYLQENLVKVSPCSPHVNHRQPHFPGQEEHLL